VWHDTLHLLPCTEARKTKNTRGYEKSNDRRHVSPFRWWNGIGPNHPKARAAKAGEEVNGKVVDQYKASSCEAQ
jgi:hypothetical protein